MKQIALIVALAGVLLTVLAPPVSSEAANHGGGGNTYKPPRGPGGHPDLNGVWQVLNTANYDLEPHGARAALALRPGPHGPVPAKEVVALGAVGHSEGETIVVDVTAQNDSTWLDRSGNWHSDQIHVVERYTPTSAQTMRYEATIEDPQVFTKPWKISMTLYRRVGDDARLQQFKCVEFVEELMYGPLRKEPLK